MECYKQYWMTKLLELMGNLNEHILYNNNNNEYWTRNKKKFQCLTWHIIWKRSCKLFRNNFSWKKPKTYLMVAEFSSCLESIHLGLTRLIVKDSKEAVSSEMYFG